MRFGVAAYIGVPMRFAESSGELIDGGTPNMLLQSLREA